MVFNTIMEKETGDQNSSDKTETVSIRQLDVHVKYVLMSIHVRVTCVCKIVEQ